MFLPVDSSSGLEKRQCYGYGCGYYSSSWSNWGRWVVLGGVILVFLVLLFLCSCMTARRRRGRGVAPYRGTGWLAPQHGPVQYYSNNQTEQTQQPYGNNAGYYAGNNAAAPPYNQYGGGQNADYYGGQQTGIELQQPGNTYQPQTGGANVYSPPAGPPPGKRDIIR